jgi:hypothetical protein
MRWESGEFNLIVVLEDENIARLKEYDPAEIKWADLREYSGLKPRTIQIAYGTPEDIKRIIELVRQDKPIEAAQLISRGWKFRPEAGDHDFGPTSLTNKPS